MTTLMDMARAERAEFAEFLAELSPQQWEAQSLCTAWSVKDVVAHVISYEELGTVGLIKRFAKGRVVRANEVGVAEYSSLSSRELVDFLGDHLCPRGLTAGFGGMIALVDGSIHHQDIRRPLGLPRRIPTDRLRRLLTLMPRNVRLAVPGRIRGLRLCANDIDWSHGHGPEVVATGEALLLAMSGRPAVVGELSGPGATVLASRLSSAR